MNEITTPAYRSARQIKAVALVGVGVGVGSVGKSGAWPGLRPLHPTADAVPPFQLRADLDMAEPRV